MKNLKKILLIFIALAAIFYLSLLNVTSADKNINELLTNGAILKINAISLLFLGSFAILRIRDYLLGTKFPIRLINSDPLASSIYYGASVFAFVIGIAMIVAWGDLCKI